MTVPEAWIEAAKKEKKIRVYGSRDNDEFAKSVRPFRERYPDPTECLPHDVVRNF